MIWPLRLLSFSFLSSALKWTIWTVWTWTRAGVDADGLHSGGEADDVSVVVAAPDVDGSGEVAVGWLRSQFVEVVGEVGREVGVFLTFVRYG